jgi:hypothetical protein
VEDVISGDLLVDTDQDGCTDTAEQQTGMDAEDTGGKRNYLNFWDFFDAPDQTTNVRDRAIAGPDFFRILARFGATDAGGAAVINRNSDPLSAPPAAPAYHPAYDRGAASGEAWDLTQADGSIAGPDFFALLVQFGHDCS